MKLRLLGWELSLGRPAGPAPERRPLPKPNERALSPLDIIQGLDEGVLAVDRARRVLVANEALAPLLNRPPAEAVGLALWEVLRHREVGEMTENALLRGLQDTRDVSFPLTAENFWRVHARPLSMGAVLTFLDLTQIRRLETVRRDFVANVSHELKTPLTSLRAALETLLDGALEDREHAREFLQTAQDQVDRLHRLIEGLLSLSLLEKREEAPAPVRTSVAEAVKKVAAALQPLARKAGVTLEAPPPDPALAVPVPADRLSQLIVNLLDNAVKFNRPDGRVRISARGENGRVLIAVSDTGAGIPPQDQPRVFERFYRVDKSRTGDAGGTGLGLSIVKHIAENAGGSVRLESVPGRGSTFTVDLPAL